MRRIGLLTYHRVHNFGAVIQSWAMTRLLAAYGSVDVLDYPTLHETGRHRRRGWKSLLPSIGRLRFGRFVSGMPLTPHLPTPDDVSRHARETGYDSLVCGSDQVWMTDPGRPLDEPFFLRLGEIGGTRRIAYAPSCGPITDFGPHVGRVGDALSRFDRISVRDAYSARLLADLGIEVDELVADPTLVADLSPLVESRPHRRPYVAVVGAHGPEDEALARRIADARGWKLLAVGCRSRFADSNRPFVSPDQWANHIAHAELVISSLFHGTALSIAFRRPFLAIPSAGRAFKIGDMLDRIGLSDRLVSDADRSRIDPDAVAELDWNAGGSLLQDWVSRSRDYLDGSFEAAVAGPRPAEAA